MRPRVMRRAACQHVPSVSPPCYAHDCTVTEKSARLLRALPRRWPTRKRYGPGAEDCSGQGPKESLLVEIVLKHASSWRSTPCIAGLGSLTCPPLLMDLLLIGPEG